MATEREFEGSSEQEALEAAARALGTTPEKVDYTLVDEGAEGVFGLGARPARIRVALAASASEADRGEAAEEAEERTTTVGPAPEKTERAREVTGDLMRLLGVEARVDVRDAEENIEVRVRDVEGGREVEALFRTCRPPLGPSLQFLINKIVNRFPEDRKHVLVEAAGASSGPERAVSRRNADGEEEFDPELVALAQLLGDRAKALGKVITVHPMMAAERRAIHQTLMKVDGVETQSSGEGLYRQMHVVPRDGGKRRRRRGRRSAGRQGRA